MRSQILALLLWSATSLPAATAFDTIIAGGRVIDGTGAPSRITDVGIRDGRIVALGTLDGSATQRIDAAGQLVTPGFIDVHTHAENIKSIPTADNFIHMGVTTVVMGNCGSSETDLGRFFAQMETNGITLNIASLIGHGSVRAQVMGGSIMRPPTSVEMRRMRNTIQKAMDDGALGMSTGLIYLPGVFATTEEIVELAKVVSTNSGIYASHMRNEGDEIRAALEEVFTVAREADLPAHVSHIKLGGQRNWHQSEEIIRLLDSAREEGLRITQDQYAYTASSTGIGNLIPENVRDTDTLKAGMAEPGFAGFLIEEMMREADARGTDFTYAVVASYPYNPSLNGKHIAQAAQTVFGDSSVESQIRLILDIQLRGGATGVFHSINEEDLRHFMLQPQTMFAADSSVREWQAGVPHPRGYGNNARVLSRYVRELELLSWEEAIRRMTALPAKTFGIQDRGVIAEGAWADIVILDPATVKDNATFTRPHQFASGFKRVLINGETVIADDQLTQHRPGKVIRRAD